MIATRRTRVEELEARISKASLLADTLAFVADAADADCGDLEKSSYWLLVVDAVAKQISFTLDGSLDRSELSHAKGGDA